MIFGNIELVITIASLFSYAFSDSKVARHGVYVDDEEDSDTRTYSFVLPKSGGKHEGIALADERRINMMTEDANDPGKMLGMQQQLLKLQMGVLKEVLDRKNMTKTVAMLVHRTDSLSDIVARYQSLSADIKSMKSSFKFWKLNMDALSQNVSSVAAIIPYLNMTASPTLLSSLHRMEEDLEKRQRRRVEHLAKEMQKAFAEIHVNRKRHRDNSADTERLAHDVNKIKHQLADIRGSGRGSRSKADHSCVHLTDEERRKLDMDRCGFLQETVDKQQQQLRDMEIEFLGVKDRLNAQALQIRSLTEDVEKQKDAMTRARVEWSVKAGKLDRDKSELVRQCQNAVQQTMAGNFKTIYGQLAEVEKKLMKQSTNYEKLISSKDHGVNSAVADNQRGNHHIRDRHMENEIRKLREKMNTIDATTRDVLRVIGLANHTLVHYLYSNARLLKTIKVDELKIRFSRLEETSEEMVSLLRNITNSRFTQTVGISRDSESVSEKVNKDMGVYVSNVKAVGKIVDNLSEFVLNSNTQESAVKDYVIQLQRKMDNILRLYGESSNLGTGVRVAPAKPLTAPSVVSETPSPTTTSTTSTTTTTMPITSTTTTTATTTTTTAATTIKTTKVNPTVQSSTSPTSKSNGVINLKNIKIGPLPFENMKGLEEIDDRSELLNPPFPSGYDNIPIDGIITEEMINIEGPGETTVTGSNRGSCKVAGFDNPLLILQLRHRPTATWMTDPLSNRPTVWLMLENMKINEILEYEDIDALESAYSSRIIKLPFRCGGTGHVIYNGSLYCNIHATNRIVKFDLTSESVIKRRIKDAGSNMTFPYSFGGYSDIDFAVDERGLWVIYATAENDGNIVIGKVNPKNLQIEISWNTDYEKNSANNAFMICGRLYATVLYPDFPMDVRYIYDTETEIGKHIEQGEIPFRQAEHYISMLDYNPRDRKLYGWRMSASWDGHAVLYDVKFENKI